MIRTPKVPLTQSRAAAPLTVMAVTIMALGIFLPMGPLADCFKLRALPPLYFPWLAEILAGYCILTALIKRYSIRRFSWQ